MGSQSNSFRAEMQPVNSMWIHWVHWLHLCLEAVRLRSHNAFCMFVFFWDSWYCSITWYKSRYRQRVLSVLVRDRERSINGINFKGSPVYSSFYQKLMRRCGRYVMNEFISQPHLAIQIPKSSFVILPVAIERFFTGEPTLDDIPTAAIRRLVAVRSGRAGFGRIDYVEEVLVLAKFQQFSAISFNFKHKVNTENNSTARNNSIGHLRNRKHFPCLGEREIEVKSKRN